MNKSPAPQAAARRTKPARRKRQTDGRARHRDTVAVALRTGKAMSAAAAQRTDGRRLRAERTRLRIIDAVIELVAATGSQPTFAAVAEHAGVTIRSVFLHFPDFETLWREATDSSRSHFDSMMVRIAPAGPVRKRLEQFVATRSALFEKLASFRHAGNLMLPHSRSMRRRRAQHRALCRHRLRETFAPELARVPLARRAVWFESLAAIADWDFWESIRQGQGLSIACARAVWLASLSAVLDQAGSDDNQ